MKRGPASYVVFPGPCDKNIQKCDKSQRTEAKDTHHKLVSLTMLVCFQNMSITVLC